MMVFQKQVPLVARDRLFPSIEAIDSHNANASRRERVCSSSSVLRPSHGRGGWFRTDSQLTRRRVKILYQGFANDPLFGRGDEKLPAQL